MNLKRGALRWIKIPLVCPRIWKASAAATTTITPAASTVPAAGVTRSAGTIRRRAVAAEPGEQARTAGPVTGAIAGAGTVTAGVLAPRLAVLHPVHQEVANQRRSADRHHEYSHPAGHGVLWLGRLGSEKLFAPQYCSMSCHDWSPNEARPFIDHLSEMWNFYPRQTASTRSFAP
jgi:hypothetical protein